MTELELKKLPKLMSEAMLTLKKLHNTPESMSLQILLGAINTVVAPRYNVNSHSVGYGIRPTVLFLMNIANTAAGKTTIYDIVTKPLAEAEQNMKDALKDEFLRYKLDLKAFAKKEAAYVKAQEEGNPIPVPDQPHPPETAKYLLSSTTLNGIIDILIGQAYTSLSTDEAGTFFSGHSFQKNGKETEMVSNLTRMWDGKVLERNTGMDSTNLYNRRVNMLFLIQEKVIRPILNNETFSDQGFLHRILITQSADYDRPDIDISAEAIKQKEQLMSQLKGFHDRLEQLLRTRPKLRDNRHFELDPITLNVDDAAQELLAQYFNATKQYGKEDGVLRNYAGFAGRLHEHALRLAANIAVFELSDRVRLSHAECAVELIEFYVTERRNLEIGVEERDNTPAQMARKIYDWIRERQWSGVANDLARRGPQWWRRLTVDTRRMVLDGLVEDELLATAVRTGGGPKQAEVVIYRLA